jgi:hypothetical protein
MKNGKEIKSLPDGMERDYWYHTSENVIIPDFY